MENNDSINLHTMTFLSLKVEYINNFEQSGDTTELPHVVIVVKAYEKFQISARANVVNL